MIAGGFFVPVGSVLQSLRIRNLALLEEVSLEFDEGFTAVTGETGAGKSILLGALSLLAGERADKTVIRQGRRPPRWRPPFIFAIPRASIALWRSLDCPFARKGPHFAENLAAGKGAAHLGQRCARHPGRVAASRRAVD